MAHVGEELALGHAGGLGPGQGLLQRALGEEALGDVLGDGQDVAVGLWVGVGDQGLQLVDVTDPPALGLDGIAFVEAAAAIADQLELPLAQPLGLRGGEHVLVGAAEVVLGVLESEDVGHRLVGQEQPAVPGALDGQAHRDVVDHPFEEGARGLQRFLGAARLGDVLADRHDIGRAVGVADGGLGLADHPIPFDAGKPAAFLDHHGFAALEHVAVFFGDRPGQRRVHHLVHGQAAMVRFSDAVEFLHGLVHHQHAAVGGLDHHGQGAVLDDDGIQGAAAPGVRFRFDLGGDVVGDQHHAADLAVVVAPRTGAPAHPALFAVGQDQPVGLALKGFAGQHALVLGGVATGFGRGVIGTAAEQGFDRQVQVGHPDRADGEEAQLPVGHRRGDGRVVHESDQRIQLADPARASSTRADCVDVDRSAHCSSAIPP